MGMDRQEVMSTRYGEMLDMIACLSIYNGGAEEMDMQSFDELFAMR